MEDDQPVLADRGQVAGAQPAVPRHHPPGQLRLAEVAAEHAGTAVVQFAGLTGRARAAVLVQDAHLGVPGGAAHAARGHVRRVPGQAAGAVAGLRHAPDHHQSRVQGLAHRAHQRRGQGGPRGEDPVGTETRAVGGALRPGDHVVQLGGHRDHHGRVLPPGQLEEPVDVPGAEEHLAARAEQRRVRRLQAEAVGQRARGQHRTGVGVGRILRRGTGVGEQPVVGVHTDLGPCGGGAGGRQQQERRLGTHLDGVGPLSGVPLQQPGHGPRAGGGRVPGDQHGAQCGQRLAQRRRRQRPAVLLCARRQDEGGRADAFQQGPYVGGGVALVHGHGDGPDLGGRQVQRQVLPAVGQVQGHHVTGGDPRLLKAARQRVHLGPPGVPGPGALAVEQGRRVAAAAHRRGEHLRQGQPVQGPAGGTGWIGRVVVCVDGHHHSRDVERRRRAGIGSRLLPSGPGFP